jgi:hypothetical protein
LQYEPALTMRSGEGEPCSDFNREYLQLCAAHSKPDAQPATASEKSHAGSGAGTRIRLKLFANARAEIYTMTKISGP